TAGCAGPLGCRVRHGDVAASALGTICSLKPFQVLAYRATGLPRAIGELASRLPRHRARSSGIGLHHTRIDRKAFRTDQPLSHATFKYRLKDVSERVALAEATMAVLGEGRVLGYRVLKSQSAEPTI